MKRTPVKYETQINNYYNNNTIDAIGSTDIEFYNGGATNFTVNGREVLPGAAWSINGFPFEQLEGKYRILFTGGSGLCVVTRRVYKNNQDAY